MNIITKMKNDWDRRAKHHSRFWIATEDYETEAVFTESGKRTTSALLGSLNQRYQPDWNVLEIGCGIGRVMRPLAPYFHHITGVDVSGEMIAKSKKWLSGVANVKTLETSGVDLTPLPSGHFDLVYSYVTFQHLPRPVFDRYLQESNRVLVQQGLLAFQLPVGRPCDAPLEDTIALRCYSLNELENKLEEYGFDLIDCAMSRKSRFSASGMIDHSFWLAEKSLDNKPDINVGWIQVDCAEGTSPVDTRLYHTFANRCLQQGQKDQAVNTYHALLAHNPSNVEGWLKLVTTLLETGETDQALTALQEFSTIHPDYEPARRTLSLLAKKENCSYQLYP